jgi:nucleoside-diphosphate-sugar epimerase
MKIWITGCAGFLGTRLAQQLAPENIVVGLSRRPSLAATHSVEVDLSHPDSEETIQETIDSFGPPEVVIHAASRQPGSGSFAAFTRSNVTATQYLVDGLAATPPRQLIFTSTLSVYSTTRKLPLTELHPASASTPYAGTKRWAEQVVATLRGPQVIVLRLPSLYGLGQADSFIDGLAKTALNDDPIELFSRGEVVREALHVSDVVRAVATCIRTPPGEMIDTMNLGNGKPIRTLEYAETLVAALESESKITVSDRTTSHVDAYADISRARKSINFRPTDLKEAMRIYAAELRA